MNMDTVTIDDQANRLLALIRKAPRGSAEFANLLRTARDWQDQNFPGQRERIAELMHAGLSAEAAVCRVGGISEKAYRRMKRRPERLATLSTDSSLPWLDELENKWATEDDDSHDDVDIVTDRVSRLRELQLTAAQYRPYLFANQIGRASCRERV